MTQEQALFLKKAHDNGYEIFILQDDEWMHIDTISYPVNTYSLPKHENLTYLSWKDDHPVGDWLIAVDYNQIVICEKKDKVILQHGIGSYTKDEVKMLAYNRQTDT